MPNHPPKVIVDNDEIIVLQAQLGQWDNLNHLLICKKTKDAVIVDPFDGKYWHDICNDNGWNLCSAWLTHSHWDHTKGVEETQQIGGNDFKIFIHQNEKERGWEGPHTNLFTCAEMTHEQVEIGDLVFEAHCTPGHTPGHTTFIGNGLIISGDCLFLGRCGRCDLFGGDENKQRQTLQYLKEVLITLDSDNIVLPGHQYALKDGTLPTTMRVEDLLRSNSALLAVDDDRKWNSLDFLSFDDSMAEKARRQTAKRS
jgi:glyoxylase-like metal-dependent hydrolase (beta-lactamase superfamily II)